MMELSQNIKLRPNKKRNGRVLFKRSELNRANLIGNNVCCIGICFFRNLWMILFRSFRCGLLRIHYPCRWIQQFHTITENFALSFARTPLCLHCVTNIQRVNKIRRMCSKSIKLHRAHTHMHSMEWRWRYVQHFTLEIPKQNTNTHIHTSTPLAHFLNGNILFLCQFNTTYQTVVRTDLQTALRFLKIWNIIMSLSSVGWAREGERGRLHA